MSSERDTLLARGAEGQTPYDLLGGGSGVERVVDRLYRRLLRDPRVRHFFVNMSIDDQVAKFAAYFTMALGGPGLFPVNYLRESHRWAPERGLNQGHFNALLEQLDHTLLEAGTPSDLCTDIRQRVAALAADVIGLTG